MVPKSNRIFFLNRIPLKNLGLDGKQVSIGIYNDSDQPATQFFLDDIRLVREAE